MARIRVAKGLRHTLIKATKNAIMRLKISLDSFYDGVAWLSDVLSTDEIDIWGKRSRNSGKYSHV